MDWSIADDLLELCDDKKWSILLVLIAVSKLFKPSNFLPLSLLQSKSCRNTLQLHAAFNLKKNFFFGRFKLKKKIDWSKLMSSR